MPNRLPSTANEPTATTAAPAAAASDARPELEDAGHVEVAVAEQRERRDDGDVDDRDREAGLHEDVQPLAAADDDDAGEARRGTRRRRARASCR